MGRITRRWKIFCLAPEEVLHLVMARWNFPACFEMVSPAGVPDDVEVVNVWFDQERRVFMFRLSHPSWDEVPDGEISPVIGRMDLERTTVCVRRGVGDVVEGHPFIDAYSSLVEENRNLRRILSDMEQDDERIRLAGEEGYRRGLRESGRLRFDRDGRLLTDQWLKYEAIDCAEQQTVAAVQEAMAQHAVNAPIVLPNTPECRIFPTGQDPVLRWEGEIRHQIPYVWVDDQGMRTVHVVRHGHDFIRLRDANGNEYDVNESRFREACRPLIG